MHILLLGHGAAAPRLTAIAMALKTIPGTFTSCYFDEDLDKVNAKRGLPRADFMLIGLSRSSRDHKSDSHAVESDLVERASQLNPPMFCGILCDENGLVSAPFLTKLGSTVRLVVAHSQDAGCNITELCERAQPLYVSDVATNAEAISAAIFDIVRPPQMRATA